MASWIRFFLIGMVIPPCMLTAGCGKSDRRSLEATGTVTINGAPVQTGQITFEITSEGDLSSGGWITDGKYRIKTTPGRKKVRITAIDPASVSQGSNDGIGPDAPPPKMAKDLVPAKYQKNPPEVEITKSGVYDFALTSDAK